MSSEITDNQINNNTETDMMFNMFANSEKLVSEDQVQEFELCATCLGGQISRRQFLGTCPLKLPLPHYNFFYSIRAL